MAYIEVALRTYILADTTVSGLISTRMYFNQAPQEVNYPYVVYNVVSDPDDRPYVGKDGISIKDLIKKLPAVIYSDHISKLLDGVVSPKKLADLDSAKKGPKRVRINRKTAYRKEDLLNWLGLRPFKFA